MNYKHRWLENSLLKSAQTRPAVYVGGARQVGKTTLLRNVFPDARYVSFDLPNVQKQIMDDPLWFIESCTQQVILDEIQHVPDLLPYIKSAIDKNRQPGKWLLTGSQHYTAIRHLSETLAGRVSILTLPSFASREWRGEKAEEWRTWMLSNDNTQTGDINEFWTQLLRGTFPEICANSTLDTENWFESYIMTYLERDLRTQLRVGNVRDFDRFLRVAAVRTAQLVNFSDLARDVGIAVSTAKEWMSVLEAGYHVQLLEPYHRNKGKRLIKSPKLYWGDTGLAAHLLGIRTLEELRRSPFLGALFENWVISEINKNFICKETRPRLWFWRTSNGTEVDIIVEKDAKLWPCEIKASSTFRPSWLNGLRSFRETYGTEVALSFIINLGTHEECGRDTYLVDVRKL